MKEKDNDKMRKIMIGELHKIRNYYRFYTFVYPSEINNTRNRLRRGKINFRTEPIFEKGKLIGYNVYVN